MISILLIIAGVIFLAGVVVFVVSLMKAPEGYEDEAGFHTIRSARSLRRTRAASSVDVGSEHAHAVNLHQPAA
jgi:hypothetical protein